MVKLQFDNNIAENIVATYSLILDPKVCHLHDHLMHLWVETIHSSMQSLSFVKDIVIANDLAVESPDVSKLREKSLVETIELLEVIKAARHEADGN